MLCADLAKASSSPTRPNTNNEDFNNRTNAIFFLIDSRLSMFESDGSSEGTPFLRCLMAIEKVVIRLAEDDNSDHFGIVLCGIENKTSDLVADHISELLNLQMSSVKVIHEIRKMIKNKCAGIKHKFGHSDAFPLSNAIMQCITACHKSRRKVYRKTIFVLTDDDDPFHDNSLEAFNTRKAAKTLMCFYADLEVIAIKSPFDSKKFYNEVILMARDMEKSTEDFVCRSLDVLNTHRKLRKPNRSRLIKNLYFQKSYVQVQIYKIFSEPTVRMLPYADRDNVITLNSQSEQPVATEEVDQNPFESDDLASDKNVANKYPVCGGRDIDISKLEMDERPLPVDVGLKIIGYLKTVNIQTYLSIAPPCLVLPLNNMSKSVKVLYSLWMHCVESDLSILCWYVFNKLKKPYLVALHPFDGSERDQPCASGFVMVKIPFLDDFAKIPSSHCDNLVATEEILASAHKCLKSTRCNYKVSTFLDNEYINKLRMIKALALDEERPELEPDPTDIDLNDLSERIGDTVISQLLCEPDTAKRPRADVSGPSQHNPKKVKKEFSEMVEACRQGKAQQLTTVELKEILRVEGLLGTTTKTKAQLVSLAHSIFQKESV